MVLIDRPNSSLNAEEQWA